MNTRVWAAGVIVAMVSIGGCSRTPAEIDARFESSDNPDIFGTLIDDRGDFEFNRDPETGNIQRVVADDGTIIPPTDGQDFSISRDDGSSIELEPSGADDVLVVVRGDQVFDDVDIVVDRDAVGDLGGVIRENSGLALASCADNQEFVDGACDLTASLDVPAIAQSIATNIGQRGEVDPAPSAAMVEALLNRYLIVLVDCCLAWDEYRDGGGDACTE